MKSAPQTWVHRAEGDDIAALVVATREAAALALVGAVDARVVKFRAYKPSAMDRAARKMTGAYVVELIVEYQTDIALADWLKAELSEVEVGQGPGRMAISEVIKQ